MQATHQGSEQEQRPLAVVMSELSKRLPLNSYGLPSGFYRPDLLPPEAFLTHHHNYNHNTPNDEPQLCNGEVTNVPNKDQLHFDLSVGTNNDVRSTPPSTIGNSVSINDDANSSLGQFIDSSPLAGVSPTALDHAYSPLNYSEGFPALEDGRPFWQMLDFEPPQAYTAFEEYLVQGKAGVRQLYLLEDSASISLSLHELQDLFNTYYWEHRIKAFDIFNAAARKHQRVSKAMNLEEEHGLLGERLRNMITTYIGDVDDEDNEFIDLLTPKTALDALGKAVQLERISAGLPAAGPSPVQKGENPGEGHSIEVTLRSIAKQHGHIQPEDQVEGGGSSNTTALRQMLNNPETAEMAQELIIKMNSGGS